MLQRKEDGVGGQGLVGMGVSINLWRLAGVIILSVTTGCAGLLDLPDAPISVSSVAVSISSAELKNVPDVPEVIAATEVPPASEANPSTTEGNDSAASEQSPGSVAEQEEPYDPFATEASKAPEDYDPWEPFNTRMFELNRWVDRYVAKPVAQVWDKVVPDPVERGLSRTFQNLHFAPRFLNNVLQGKVKGASIELSRFVINSTLGIAGFFDFAGDVFGLYTPYEDMGQTLGAWGIPPGPYVVLPLITFGQPLTVRDAFGYVGDIVINPVYYFLFSTIRVGQPAAVTHQSTASFSTLGIRAAKFINERSFGLERYQGV
jgi:phospholipid-binding lipoprotein MlaA